MADVALLKQPTTSFNQFSKSGKQALKAYCLNIYTVFKYTHVHNAPRIFSAPYLLSVCPINKAIGPNHGKRNAFLNFAVGFDLLVADSFAVT